MKKQWIRHGDIALVRVLPKSEHPVQHALKRIVLVKGEATGHAHVLEGATIWADQETEPTFVKVKGVATLTHQEHATLEIPEGTWQVIRQREFWGREQQIAD